MPLVTLVPEPKNRGSTAENGILAGKEEKSELSAGKSSSSTSEQQQSIIPTSAKKGRVESYFTFSL